MSARDQDSPGCDLLVVAPHSDDAEIGLGGTLHLLAGRGRRIWVADLTRGELGTNATVDERWQEARQASQVLGLTGRLQLGLPDGFVAAGDPAQVRALVAVLRMLRPRWVATAPDAVRHPDHQQTPVLVEKACFLARLVSLTVGAPELRAWPAEAALPEAAGSWRPEALLHTCAEGEDPDLVFDVTDHWQAKQDALACYPSQFQRGRDTRPTAINDPAFLARIERRGRTWGQRVGVAYGEALRTRAAVRLRDLPGDPWLS